MKDGLNAKEMQLNKWRSAISVESRMQGTDVLNERKWKKTKHLKLHQLRNESNEQARAFDLGFPQQIEIPIMNR